jgi:hypothetical protein
MALGVAVFWAYGALPFQDLSAHAGLVAMRHRYAESAFEQRFYAKGSLVGPYSLFLGLGEFFERAVGPLRAARALGTLPVLATPLALLYARRRLHQDRSPWAGYLGVALSFGFLTLLGLASYLLAVALLVVAVTVGIELLADVDDGRLRDATRRERTLGGFALVVGLAHGFALLVLALVMSAMTLAKGGPSRWRRGVRLRALLPAFVPQLWSALYGGAPPGASGAFELVPSADYQTLLDKLSLLATPTLMTRTGIDLAVGLAVWVVLALSLAATVRERPPSSAESAEDAERRSRAHSRALTVGAVSVAVGFFALPHAFKWFGFIDGRMLPVCLFLAILCVRRSALGPRLDRSLIVVAVASGVALPCLALLSSRRFQAEAWGYEEVLRAVPPEARLLNLPLDPDSDVFTAHPFVHYDKLVAVREEVLVSDVWPDRASALYPTPENPQLRLPASYNPSNLKRIDWPAYDLRDWTHVLVRVRPDAPAPTVPGDLQLLVHAGGWWLYRASRSSVHPAMRGWMRDRTMGLLGRRYPDR